MSPAQATRFSLKVSTGRPATKGLDAPGEPLSMRWSFRMSGWKSRKPGTRPNLGGVYRFVD
jgi:hypothetical protein